MYKIEKGFVIPTSPLPGAPGALSEDGSDNCPLTANADQADADGDNIGDACETDTDGDSVLNAVDNCPAVANADQADDDANGKGNACDLAAGSVAGFVVSNAGLDLGLADLAGVQLIGLNGPTNVRESFTSDGMTLTALGSGTGSMKRITYTATRSANHIRVQVGGSTGALPTLRVHAACVKN